MMNLYNLQEQQCSPLLEGDPHHPCGQKVHSLESQCGSQVFALSLSQSPLLSVKLAIDADNKSMQKLFVVIKRH